MFPKLRCVYSYIGTGENRIRVLKRDLAWLQADANAWRREVAVLTVLRDLAGASLQQQTDPPASRLDQLDGSGVRHALGALAVDLDDLIPDLEVCDADQRLFHTRS